MFGRKKGRVVAKELSEGEISRGIGETAKDGYKRLQEAIETEPKVPDDVTELATFAAGMHASVFYDLYVSEAIVKAYKRGFNDGAQFKELP